MGLSTDMPCQELVELVTAYLDGALSPADRERFEAHWRTCPGCRTYLAQMQLVVQAPRNLWDPTFTDPGNSNPWPNQVLGNSAIQMLRRLKAKIACRIVAGSAAPLAQRNRTAAKTASVGSYGEGGSAPPGGVGAGSAGTGWS